MYNKSLQVNSIVIQQVKIMSQRFKLPVELSGWFKMKIKVSLK